MKTLKIGYMSLMFFLLYAPIAIVIAFSFNSSNHSLLWHHFSLQWYKALIHDSDIIRVTLHSLSIATLAASLAVIIGSIIAVGLYRYHYKGRKVLYSTILMLIIIPDVVIGIAFLMFFSSLNIPLGFFSLLIAHISFCIPFVVITLASHLNQLNPSFIDAAKDLGANDYVLYKKILLPLLSPALLTGWLLSFALSMDDVLISYFVSGPDYQILPLKIYAMVKLGVNPEINALSTILFLLTLTISFLGFRYTRRRS